MSQRTFDLKYPIDIHASIKLMPGAPSRWRPWLLFAVCVCLTGSVFGQNRQELVDRRQRLLQEIEQTEGLLKETQENKAATMDRYFALQDQIKKRQQLIITVREEIDYINQSIDRSHLALEGLNDDIGRLKEEYAGMLRSAYRHKHYQSYLLFLFSANSINDAFQRWQYLRQYDSFRERQAQLITETQEMLKSKTSELETRRTEKEGLLTEAEQQRLLLDKELKDKDNLLENLEVSEAKLVADLEGQRRAHEKLNTAIEAVIRDEMARKRKEARRPDAVSAANAEAAASLSGNFVRSKGSLPWPVKSGEIIRQFGTQPHPTIKTVKITNNGIDIRTDSESEVFSIFEGQVAGTQFVPGYQNMVIIQHGEYYTVYSNLEEIYVKRGDRLRSGQTIGKVGSKKPEVHFEVWREKQRLNPVDWVNNRPGAG